MKSRIFRPEFLNDERLYQCGEHALVLYLGLMSMSDREGRLEDRPVRIKAVVLPYHDVDIDSLLTNLHEQNFITRYEVDGVKCIEIKDFEELQKPHPKETKSNLPVNSMKCREISRKEIKCREKVSTSISKGKSKSKSISKEGECEGKQNVGKETSPKISNDKSIPPVRTPRDELGHVLLSDEEHQKLLAKYPALPQGIQRLSDWIESKKGQRAWFYKAYSGAYSYLNPVSCWVWREVSGKPRDGQPRLFKQETRQERNRRYLQESLDRDRARKQQQANQGQVIDITEKLPLELDYIPSFGRA